MNRRQIKSLLFSGRPLKPDLFEFRADRGVFEDAGTDPAEDTDPVYQWSDQGPSSRFATQATLASRPTISSAAAPNYVSFDGTDDMMTFGGSTVFASSGSPWSFEAWINLTNFSASTYPHIFALKTDTTNIYEIGISSDVNYLGLHFGSTSTWARLKTDLGTAFWLGIDRHVVVTYNGQGAGTAANFTAYVDGVLRTTSAAFPFGATTNTESAIGATLAAANPWRGRMYKLAGFSRALTQTQVSARFAIGVAG